MPTRKQYLSAFALSPYVGRIAYVGGRRFATPIVARGALHLSAAYLLLVDHSIIDVFSLVECAWDYPSPGSALVPFELHYANQGPVLLHVVRDKKAKSRDFAWARECIDENLLAYGCSAQRVWCESDLDPIAVANARQLIDDSEPATELDHQLVTEALGRLGGATRLADLKMSSALGRRAHAVILDLILDGRLRLAKPDTPICASSIIVQGGS